MIDQEYLKMAFITYKKDYIRVITGYRNENSLTISGEPVHILPVESDESRIKESLLDCFHHSRDITKKEEDEFYSANNFLKALKEKSWKSSYNVSSCEVYYSSNEGFTLFFTKYDPKSKSTPVVKSIKSDAGSIEEVDVENIMEILKKF